MLYKTIKFPLPKRAPLLEKPFFFLGCLITALGCSNIFSLQGYLFLIGLVVLLLSVVASGRAYIGVLPLGALLFGVAYMVGLYFSGEFSIIVAVYHVLLPLVLSQLVFRISSLPEQKEQMLRVFAIALSIVLGLFVSFLFILVATVKRQGLYFAGGVLTDYWTNWTVSRTGISLYCVGAMGIGTFVICAKTPFRKWYTIVGSVLIIALSTVVGVVAGNRSFLVSLLSLVAFWVVYALLKIKKTAVKGAIIATVSVLFIGFVLLYIGVIPIPDFLLKIPVVSRILSGGSNSERLLLYKEFFSNFYKYPLGGVQNVMTRRFVHNFWLDFYTYGGVISFGLVTLLFVRSFFNARLCYRKGIISLPTVLLILTLAVAYASLGMLEPIYQANSLCLQPLFIIMFYLEAKAERIAIRTDRYRI